MKKTVADAAHRSQTLTIPLMAVAGDGANKVMRFESGIISPIAALTRAYDRAKFLRPFCWAAEHQG